MGFAKVEIIVRSAKPSWRNGPQVFASGAFPQNRKNAGNFGFFVLFLPERKRKAQRIKTVTQEFPDRSEQGIYGLEQEKQTDVAGIQGKASETSVPLDH